MSSEGRLLAIALWRSWRTDRSRTAQKALSVASVSERKRQLRERTGVAGLLVASDWVRMEPHELWSLIPESGNHQQMFFFNSTATEEGIFWKGSALASFSASSRPRLEVPPRACLPPRVGRKQASGLPWGHHLGFQRPEPGHWSTGRDFRSRRLLDPPARYGRDTGLRPSNGKGWGGENPGWGPPKPTSEPRPHPLSLRGRAPPTEGLGHTHNSHYELRAQCTSGKPRPPASEESHSCRRTPVNSMQEVSGTPWQAVGVPSPLPARRLGSATPHTAE